MEQKLLEIVLLALTTGFCFGASASMFIVEKEVKLERIGSTVTLFLGIVAGVVLFFQF